MVLQEDSSVTDAVLRVKCRKASPNALEHVHARGNRAVFMRISVGLVRDVST